jgi:hypothetical protein
VSVVTYVSPFVPAEWIAAHGLSPRRITPRAAADPRSGACPFAEDATAAGIDIVTTTCDQARRSAEEMPGSFLINVPHTITPAARGLYEDELHRLSDWLVDRGGEVPDDRRLAATMIECEDARPTRPPTLGTGVPIALVGGPIWGPHGDLKRTIEDAGGEVVLDATETGERGLPRPFDPTRTIEDPFTEMVDAYWSIPDAFRRPNDDLYRWLETRFAARGVRGVVFVRCVWCDLWHAELARLKEWTDLPVADVDLTGESAALPRAETRIQALLDAIR